MRLLLVEDNEALAGLLVSALANHGFTTDLVSTAGDAEVTVSGGEYRLMLLDLRLRDEDGLDLLRRLRRHGLRIPVIIITTRGSVRDRNEGLGAGADDYLVKPFAVAELVDRIQALLSRPGG